MHELEKSKLEIEKLRLEADKLSVKREKAELEVLYWREKMG